MLGLGHQRARHLQQLALPARQRAGELVASSVSSLNRSSSSSARASFARLLAAPQRTGRGRSSSARRVWLWRRASCSRAPSARPAPWSAGTCAPCPCGRPRGSRRPPATSPLNVHVPRSGLSNPVSRLKNVVLPAPLGPIRRGDAAALDLQVVDVDRHEAAELPVDAVGHEDRVGLRARPATGSTAGEVGAPRIVSRCQRSSTSTPSPCGHRGCPAAGRSSAASAPGRPASTGLMPTWAPSMTVDGMNAVCTAPRRMPSVQRQQAPEDDRPDDRAEHPRRPAQDEDGVDEERHRRRPKSGCTAFLPRIVDDAGDGADHATDDQGLHLVAVDVLAQRAGGVLVLADRLQHPAPGAAHQPER